ncbi:molybdate ABC transporter permease subunit [Bacillus alkalicellulosilyticus]|uniref:molybdate ABC transporter permease subunit n=1 Tax=Alkalihalobacterium alkalicellulosilyticum TaxID=1912214 RepID=UPI0009977400|nr:molybdate ABC transporter permease subunit [Bacillus alkalicellulosilyticus]
MSDINLFPLVLSLQVALTATLLSVVVGLPIAYYLSHSKNRFADIIDTFVTLPIVLPPTVLGYYLLVLLGRQSSVGAFLEEHFNIMIVFTPTGAVIAALIVGIPFLIKSAKAAFTDMDKHIIHAARVLGKNEWYIFFSIIVPLSWPGILTGVTLSFARSLGDFGVTLMVAGSIPGETMTMPIAIYDALLSGNRTLAHTLVFIMTGTSLLILYMINRLERKISKGR